MNYKLEDLVRIAKRDNNSIRPYLYVDPLQGKHLSVNPGKSMDLFQKMAGLLEEKYPKERILVIGFAETATGIGAAVAYFGSNVAFMSQTTRENIENSNYLYFTESHSHAKEQGIIIDNYSEVLKKVDRIVFVEDEVTTGNTIMKLVTALNETFPEFKMKYTILCILNSMKETRMAELAQLDVDCLYIARMEFEYRVNEIDKYQYEDCKHQKVSSDSSMANEILVHEKCDMKVIKPKDLYIEACDGFVEKVLNRLVIKKEYKKILVLGTEEFMFLPMYFAKELQDQYRNCKVEFHATTRSPIMISKDEGYPLFNRYTISSFYEENRITYIYNLEKYDYVIVITDSQAETSGGQQLIAALETQGNENIQIVRWCK